MVQQNDFTKVYEQSGIDVYYVSGNNPIKFLKEYTGSDNTASGTYTTVCDQIGSGILKSITCSSSNHLAAPSVRVTIDGVEQDLFGSSNANAFRTHSTDDHKTWYGNVSYNNGIKVEVDSSNASYTTYCTVVLEQDQD